MGVLEEAVEGPAVHESCIFQLLSLHPQFLHGHFFLVYEFAHLYVAVSCTIPLFSQILNDFVANVLLALLEVALAAFALAFHRVKERSGFYVGASVYFDDGEEALRFRSRVTLISHIGIIVVGGKVAL